MIKKILKTMLILIIAVFALQSNAHAAVIVSTDKQVESGSGTVTVTVTSKQALGAYTLTLTDTAGLTLTGATVGAGGTVKPDNKTITNASDSGITNLGSYTFAVPTVSSDTKYNIKFSITGMETPDLQSVPDETNTATITVKAPIPDPPPAPVDTRSTNANLSNLGINPKEYDFKTFTSPNRTSHTATVPNEVEEVEVWYKQADTKSTVSITAGKGLKVNNGKVSGLQVGKNTITITVTAEAGNTKKYTITVTRKEAGATVVEPPVEEPTNEQPEVPENPTDNEVTEPGEGIEKLTIAGITLKPEFDTNTYEYEAILEEDLNTLEIDAKTTSDKYRVVVAGNENLKNGENLITLIVYDAQNTVVATYQVTVMKNTVNQNEINNIFSELKKEEMIKRIAIITALVLIVILIIVYVVVRAKIKKAKNKTNKEENNKDENIENDLENEFKIHDEIETETISENEVKKDIEETTEAESVIKTENNLENDINFEDIMMKIRNIENITKTGKLSNSDDIEKIEDIENTKTLEENIEDITQTDKKKGKHF